MVCPRPWLVPDNSCLVSGTQVNLGEFMTNQDREHFKTIVLVASPQHSHLQSCVYFLAVGPLDLFL